MSFNINKADFICIVTILLTIPVMSYASNWVSIADEIVVVIDKTTSLYRDGDSKQAKRKIIEAYFGIFESKKFEAAMRQEMGSRYAYEVERKFGAMRKIISKKKSADELDMVAQDIIQTIKKDAVILDKKGIPLHVFDPTK